MKFLVLSYYKYIKISNPSNYRENHHLFCIKNNLRGRIIISEEGINGTVSGQEKDCNKYIEYLRSDSRFSDINFKSTICVGHCFNKLNVRLKKEIVNSGLGNFDSLGEPAKYITPKEFRSIKDDEGVVILDLRSKYECDQGTFKNSIHLNLNNLRDLPNKLSKIEKLKNKKIITCCTGNVKCEKGSAFLKKKGFKNIYQLKGGILEYGLKTDGKDFEGSLYVFDNRLSIPINSINPSIKNKCYNCKVICERLINCANPNCNLHIALCSNCGEKLKGACSKECSKSPKLRKYDGTGYYTTKLNGYNPYKDYKRQ